MDEEQDVQQPEPKISFVVGLLGLIIALFFDALSLIPFVGDIEEAPAAVIFILNIISGMGTTVLATQGIAMVLKAIPLLQELPLWTVAWVATWYLENHPSKLTSALETVASVAAVAEGSAGAATTETTAAGVTAAEEAGGAFAVASESAAAGSAEAAGVAGATAEESNAARELSENARPSEKPQRHGSRRSERQTMDEIVDEKKTEHARYQEESEREYASEIEPMSSPDEDLEKELLSERGPTASNKEDEREERNEPTKKEDKKTDAPVSDSEIQLRKRQEKILEIKTKLTKPQRSTDDDERFDKAA
jgi:hypothetical protein